MTAELEVQLQASLVVQLQAPLVVQWQAQLREVLLWWPPAVQVCQVSGSKIDSCGGRIAAAKRIVIISRSILVQFGDRSCILILRQGVAILILGQTIHPRSAWRPSRTAQKTVMVPSHRPLQPRYTWLK